MGPHPARSLLLEALESVLWVESLSVFMTSLVKKPLLTAGLIGKFQRIFPCLQEGCCVQTSQDVDGLTTEPPYPCLKLNLELDVLDFHGSHLSTEEGTECRCPRTALYFPMQSFLFGWLARFEPDSGEGRGSSQASVFHSFPQKLRKNLSGEIPFSQISPVKMADLSPMASGSFCILEKCLLQTFLKICLNYFLQWTVA